MMKMKRRNLDRRAMIAGIGGVVAGSILSRPALAGNLESPPGPPSPTGLPLEALAERSSRTREGCANPCTPVESLGGTPDSLYTIVAPGSYTLTRNLVVGPNMHGISILSPDVDLDLYGFHVMGPPGQGTPTAGIYCNTENVTVSDGSVRGFHRGLDFQQASRFIIWDVTSLEAAGQGVFLGSTGECYDIDVHNCPGVGIACAGSGNLVHECGVWSSNAGFVAVPGGNLFLSNTAIGCNTPYQLGVNAHGPIVVTGSGDISMIPGSAHPGANFAVA